MRIIAGEARGRKIETPAGLHTRPTLDRVRENLFNMIQNNIPDSRVLDLFAGSGALSLEALSRGASFAVMNDSDRNAFAVQKNNIALLHYEARTRQIHSDWRAALSLLQKEREMFDLIFLDPPYCMTDLRDVFCSVMPLVREGTLIILEHEADRQPQVAGNVREMKKRSWGFCAVTIYQFLSEGE